MRAERIAIHLFLTLYVWRDSFGRRDMDDIRQNQTKYFIPFPFLMMRSLFPTLVQQDRERTNSLKVQGRMDNTKTVHDHAQSKPDTPGALKAREQAQAQRRMRANTEKLNPIKRE